MTFNCSYKDRQGDNCSYKDRQGDIIVATRAFRVTFNCSYKDSQGDV